MNEAKVGARIAALRTERKMTQAELAERLGVSDKAVSKWELGGCYPDVTMFPLIADIFGVSVDYLMRGGSRRVQKLKSMWFGNDKYRRFLNEQYLANGWKIVDMKLAGDGEGGGFMALVIEKEIFEE
ncbi:MAG: helix-turn-helix transcriptional regulator [Ruminococcaceae bacterium]|nr:helix-turn-helix transcriptional regulator [Oscillospiraceae bacterium]